jgi:hypothetical protein
LGYVSQDCPAGYAFAAKLDDIGARKQPNLVSRLLFANNIQDPLLSSRCLIRFDAVYTTAVRLPARKHGHDSLPPQAKGWRLAVGRNYPGPCPLAIKMSHRF